MAGIFCVCLCFLNDLMGIIGRESELDQNPQLGWTAACFCAGWIFYFGVRPPFHCSENVSLMFCFCFALKLYLRSVIGYLRPTGKRLTSNPLLRKWQFLFLNYILGLPERNRPPVHCSGNVSLILALKMCVRSTGERLLQSIAQKMAVWCLLSNCVLGLHRRRPAPFHFSLFPIFDQHLTRHTVP